MSETEEVTGDTGAKDAPNIPTLVLGGMDIPMMFYNAVPVTVETAKKEKLYAYEVTFKTRIPEEQFPWLMSLLRDHKLVASAKNQGEGYELVK
jgi:hypothetical protein